MKKNAAHIAYHIAVVILSAAFAITLPETVRYFTQTVLPAWSYIENEELILIITEVIVAILLIVGVNALIRNWDISRQARSARIAGLECAVPVSAFLARRRITALKDEQGFGRNVMVIGSTGARMFTDPAGDLHRVLRNCREAKIMLLNPLKEGVAARANSLDDPEITPEKFREDIIRSIDFLKGLKALQKNVRLKLYRDVPLLKLAILGDYLFMQHYPAGQNIQSMPEFVFKHDRSSNLFSLFYQYFVTRWLDPRMPEYDLVTDELVYRDRAGREVKREPFNEVVMEY